MHLNQIHSFLTVVQTLNFTNAAIRNKVPQSTISRQIDSLEEELGAKLFYRTRREVKLTDEGKAFLPYAKEIADAAKNGVQAVKQLHEGANGRLSIAVTASTQLFLFQCLRKFSAQYPDIAIDVSLVSSGEVLLDQSSEPFDFHFLYSDMLTESDEFEMLETHVDTLGLITSKDHPLAKKPLNFDSLRNEKFLIISEEESPILYMQIMGIFQSHHFTPHTIKAVNDINSLLLSVASNLGISIICSSIAEKTLPDMITFIPFEDLDTEVPCAVAWRRELLNPAARLFLQTVRQVLEENPARTE